MSKVIWALFGNDEDGIYGSTRWNPEGKKTVWTAIRWWFRNPFHNFTHHVIGIYGKPFISVELISKGSPGRGFSKTARVLGSRSYPYWHYSGNGWQAYLGWRSSGAFGISLRRRTDG